MTDIRRCKAIVLGMMGAGKTSLLLKKYGNSFDPHISQTHTFNFYTITLEFENNKLELVCWDTATQEKYDAIGKLYYQGSEAALILYDITSRTSFEAVPKYIQGVKEYSTPNCLLILIGTKQDLESERAVPVSSGLFLARSHNMLFIETSSKSNQNIDKAFEILGEALIKTPIPVRSNMQGSLPSISINSPSHLKKRRKKKFC